MLVDLGVDGVPAPSCASHKVHYFSSSHEKVIVIDGEWCLVQSGNYSENSIPLNTKDGGDPEISGPEIATLDWHLRSREMASFFSRVLESDMAKEIDGPEALANAAQSANTFLVESAPTKIQNLLFPEQNIQTV